ncbi:MAG: DUF1569 domain-containing protein [Ferruginibacter sp.]
MESLFDVTTYNHVKERLNNLAPESKAKWGKMNVSQMLTHCQRIFHVPLSEKKLRPSFLGKLLGWAFKEKLYNDERWKNNLPTSPDFRIEHDCDFDKEKETLTSLIDKFYNAGPTGVGKYPHPFFGKFTPPQWGQSMYKHLDHHLRQFGV